MDERGRISWVEGLIILCEREGLVILCGRERKGGGVSQPSSCLQMAPHSLVQCDRRLRSPRCPL